jgi:type I restriction enzyme S subunit
MLDKKKNRGELHPYLGNIHVRWGVFDLEDLPEMRFQEHEHERYGLKRGDLVVCEGGEPGRCALWNDQVPNMKIQKALHRVRPHECLDSRYLLYWFLWAGQRSYFDQFFTGATIKHLPGEKLAKVEIDLPELPTQRKIAGILSAYDDLIENNLRRIKILEQMAQSLYREWFVYFRFPGHESARFVDSELGQIPKGWEVKKLGQVTKIVMGLSPKGDTYNDQGDGMPLVNGPVEFSERFTKRIKWTTSPTKTCKAGDLVVCVRGSTTGKNVKSDGEYCLGRGVCSISSEHQSFVDQMFANELPTLLGMTSGSTFPSWTGPVLQSHPVISPSKTLVAEFDRMALPMSDAIQSLAFKNDNLRRTRDILLPKLLTAS